MRLQFPESFITVHSPSHLLLDFGVLLLVPCVGLSLADTSDSFWRFPTSVLSANFCMVYVYSRSPFLGRYVLFLEPLSRHSCGWSYYGVRQRR